MNDQPADLDFAGAAATVIVRVVPSARVKRIGNHWRAEQKLHGTLRHADLNLLDGILLEHVALLNVDAEHASTSQHSADYHSGAQGEAVETIRGMGHNGRE